MMSFSCHPDPARDAGRAECDFGPFRNGRRNVIVNKALAVEKPAVRAFPSGL